MCMCMCMCMCIASACAYTQVCGFMCMCLWGGGGGIPHWPIGSCGSNASLSLVADSLAGQRRGNASRSASERRADNGLGELKVSCRSLRCRRRCVAECHQQAPVGHLVVVLEVDGGCGVGIFDVRDDCARVARAVMLFQHERHRKITCTVLQQQHVAQSWPSCCCKAPASAPPRRDDARLETPNEPRASSGGDQQAEHSRVDLASTLRSMRGARSADYIIRGCPLQHETSALRPTDDPHTVSLWVAYTTHRRPTHNPHTTHTRPTHGFLVGRIDDPHTTHRRPTHGFLVSRIDDP